MRNTPKVFYHKGRKDALPVECYISPRRWSLKEGLIATRYPNGPHPKPATCDNCGKPSQKLRVDRQLYSPLDQIWWNCSWLCPRCLNKARAIITSLREGRNVDALIAQLRKEVRKNE